MGVLIHELLHIVLGHHKRLGGRDTSRFNRACDCRINYVLTRDGFSLPDDVVFIEKVLPDRDDYAQLTEEQIYDLMPEDQEIDFNDIVFNPDPDINDQIRETILNGIIARHGNAVMHDFSLQAPVSAVPGRRVDFPGRRFNYAVRSRKQLKTYNSPTLGLDPSIILPAKAPAEPIDIAILIDVSGSMSNEDIGTATGHVKRALSGRRGRVRVLCHDTERKHDQYYRVSCLPTVASSGGGTALRDSLRGVKCDACIVVSDLESSDGIPEVSFPTFVIGSHTIPQGWQRL